MRCVCGRTLHPSWREWLWLGMIVVALGSMLRAERERRELAVDRRAMQQLGADGRATLDSLRGLPCIVPGTVR